MLIFDNPNRSQIEPMKTLFFAMLCGALFASSRAAEIRLGIIGLDTSHVTAFTELLNNPAAKDHVPGAKVVAAFKGGSADIPSSIGKVRNTPRSCATNTVLNFMTPLSRSAPRWTRC